MFEDFPIVKFFILWIPFSIFVILLAPSLKWKLLFPICGAIGIGLALMGKSINLHRGGRR